MSSVEEPVFWEVFHRSSTQRRELAARLGVSAPTISRAIDTLMDWELVIEDEIPVHRRGRRPRILRINPELGKLIGIEIDREHITVVVTDMGGGLLGRAAARCAPAESLKGTLDTAVKLAAVALEDAGVELAGIRRVGVGHTGALDLERGVCLSWGESVQWRRVPLRQMMRETFHLEVTMDDRARAMATAERRQAPRDARHPNAIYVTIGTGIGCGLFVAGRLVRGANQAAGELGHMLVDPDGPLCSCGAVGCVEALASVPAIMRRVEAAIGAGRSTDLVRTIGACSKLEIDDVLRAAKRGDALAAEILENAGAAIGTAIAGAVNLLNPSLVVLCGKLAYAAREWLMRPVRHSIEQRCFEVVSRRLEVRLAPFRKDLVAVGCALLAAQEEAALELQRRFATLPERHRRCSAGDGNGRTSDSQGTVGK